MTLVGSAKKSLTKEAVKETAEGLMKKNGSTTTLDVKNTLRANDYWCVQSEVSSMLQTVSAEEGWDYSNPSGQYNEYSLPVATTATTTATPTGGVTAATIVAALCGVHVLGISPTSRLLNDLGVDDEDAEELVEELELKFPSLDFSDIDEESTVGEIQDILDAATTSPPVAVASPGTPSTTTSVAKKKNQDSQDVSLTLV